MVWELAEKLTDYLEEKEIITEDKEVYTYGFALNISTAFSFGVVMLIGLMRNNLLGSVLYIISFACLRTRVGGYHCKSYLTCDLSYISIYIVYESLRLLDLSQYLYGGLAMIAVTMLWVLAPIGHANKPLDEYQLLYGKRNSRITLAVLTILMLALWLVSGGLAQTLCFAIMINGILFIIGKEELKHEKINEESTNRTI